MIIWFIGLSGSGKTYLAERLYQKVGSVRPNTFLLDGDMFRDAMGNDLGYTFEDREKNGWRITRLSKLLDSQGINVIAPTLSNYPEQQNYLQSHVAHYKRVYVSADPTVVQARDVKGVYKNRVNVVGQDIPFNPPHNPDYTFLNSFSETEATAFVDALFADVAGMMA